MSPPEPEGMTSEEFGYLVKRAGLTLTPEESEHLKALFEPYREGLELLHGLELDAEEPALTFDPEWRSEEGHDEQV